MSQLGEFCGGIRNKHVFASYFRSVLFRLSLDQAERSSQCDLFGRHHLSIIAVLASNRSYDNHINVLNIHNWHLHSLVLNNGAVGMTGML